MAFSLRCVWVALPLLVVGVPVGCGSGSNKVVLPDGETITLSVDPPSATKEVGQTQAYSAIATDSDGTTEDITNLVSWSSSDPAIATIGLKTGIATGKAPGSVVITAKRNNVVATATLKVIAAVGSDGSGGMSDGSGGTGGVISGSGGAAGTADAAAGAPGTPGGPATRIYVSNLGGEGVIPSIRA